MNIDINTTQTYNNRHTHCYQKHNMAYAWSQHRLKERLEFIKIKPSIVLDLGCGSTFDETCSYFPNAHYIGVDISHEGLSENKTKYHLLQSHAEQLPLKSNSIDLVISNQLLPFCNNVAIVFSEVFRVLKPNGLFLFSTFGPDTLRELKSIFMQHDTYPHVYDFPDMHNIGDALLSAYFSDPVIDVEHLSIHYTELKNLWSDLKYSSSANALAHRRKTLTGKNRWQTIETALKQQQNLDGKLEISYEVVFGHAWKPKTQTGKRVGDEIHFNIEQLL